MKYFRIKKNTHFQKLFKRGKRFFSPCITILCIPSNQQSMAVAISKKYGKAVKRNRIKRLCREVYRLHVDELCSTYDVIILPKISEEYKFETLESSIISCFKKVNQCYAQ